MYKQIHQSALAEYEKFWERKNTARPVLNMSCRKPDEVPYPAPVSLEQQWLDVEYKYHAYKHNVATTEYLAEGIPCHFANYGPGMLSACIGGGYQFSPRTVWLDTKRIIEDWENPPAVEFNAQSDLWQSLLREQALFASDPDAAFSMTDIGGILDIVASLRGTQNLLYDLYDYPEELKEFSARVKQVWFDVFDQQAETLRKANLPYNSWMEIPSAKPWYPLQCDFCYMISPAQFEEFVLPDLSDQVAHMERSIYHLDGVGELNHLDMILDIPGLTGIQWTPGTGCEPLWDERWFPIYRKIQDKKKNLVLLGGINECDMAGAERLIKTLDPVGFYIKCWSSTKQRGEQMVQAVTKWCE